MSSYGTKTRNPRANLSHSIRSAPEAHDLVPTFGRLAITPTPPTEKLRPSAFFTVTPVKIWHHGLRTSGVHQEKGVFTVILGL